MNPGDHPVELLSAYLDESLSEVERRLVEVHLRQCGNCAALLADLRTLADDLRDEAIPDVPTQLERAVRRTLDREDAPRRVVPLPARWHVPATVAATLGAAALMVVAFRFLPGEAVRRGPAPAPAMESPSRSSVFPEPREKGNRGPFPQTQVPVAESAGESAEPPPYSTAPPRSDRPESAPVPGGSESRAGDRDIAALSASPDDGLRAKAGPPAQTTGSYYREVLTLRPGPECDRSFRPHAATLRKYGPDPESAISSADRFVEALEGTIIVSDRHPDERRYEVRAEDWDRLRDYLLEAGFVSDDAARPVPEDADCVSVRIVATPEPR
jgi:hypothetical protein